VDGCDLPPLRTHPIAERRSKVTLDQLAPPPQPLPSLLGRLPRLLAADTLREVTLAIADARRAGRPVILAMGAHVIKCGLAPVVIELARRGIVTAVATNGASLVHDCELALFGHTSEDVARGLEEGTFGMAEETHSFINGAVTHGAAQGLGIGEAVGRALLAAEAPNASVSLFAECARLKMPMTVHVALGTDIVHVHPTADGAAIGEGSLRDFRKLCPLVADLQGGVLLNVGSAVILPEVLLKAFAVAANLGKRLDGCLAVDLDMVRSYRTNTQIVERIRHLGGRGAALTGHHEIMLPLLAGLVLAELDAQEGGS
jgi:hypothetical protein